MPEHVRELPLRKHKSPHRELARRYKQHYANQDYRTAAVGSFLLFLASMFASLLAGHFASEVASNPVTDIILSNTPALHHEVFLISILGKGLFAALEVLLGAALFFTDDIVDTINQFVSDELVQDPSDVLPHWAQQLLHPSPEAQVFAAFYLVSHGVIKLFLVAGLLRNKIWAYPASIAVFAVFILYQLFRYFTHSHSIWLLFITFADIVIIWLVYHEYQQVLKRGTVL
jgi:uncharacterized membrane protein